MNVGTGAAGKSRRSGLGSASGYADGLALPMLYAAVAPHHDRPILLAALVLAAGAMIGRNALLVALGLTDPRSWTVDAYEALVGSQRQ